MLNIVGCLPWPMMFCSGLHPAIDTIAVSEAERFI